MKDASLSAGGVPAWLAIAWDGTARAARRKKRSERLPHHLALPLEPLECNAPDPWRVVDTVYLACSGLSNRRIHALTGRDMRTIAGDLKRFARVLRASAKAQGHTMPAIPTPPKVPKVPAAAQQEEKP